jgi:hypothetical protein
MQPIASTRPSLTCLRRNLCDGATCTTRRRASASLQARLRNPSQRWDMTHDKAKWDMTHDGKNVDRPSVSAQSGGRTLHQENQAYVRNDHHDKDVSRNQGV